MNNLPDLSKLSKEELLRQLKLEQLRRQCKSDIDKFAHEFLHHLLKCPTPPFHLEIFKLLSSEQRLAIAAPRSFAKSTITDVLFTLHTLLYGHREDILIVSNSGSLSDELVRKVKLELETNQKLRDVYGDQVNQTKWTQNHIILRNGNQLRGKGRGYQIRGFRPTRVILDDLEDDEMVRSKDQRDKLREWFLGPLLNTLEPGQQLVYIGTLLHPLSLLKQIIDGEDPIFAGWCKRKFTAIVRAGDGIDSIWPEKWSLEQLLQRQEEIGPQKFEAEYMNNPLADSTVVFHPDTYKYYDTIEERIERVICGFDLIGSAREFESKDYVAFVTIANGESGRNYVLDARHGHWTQEEIADQFIELNKEFEPEAFVGEEVGFQQIVHDYLIKKAREKKIYLPIRGIKFSSYSANNDSLHKAKDKVSRALTVQHIFTQGLFWMRRDQRALYEELATFPASDYDDQVDALVHALHIITGRGKMEVIGGTAGPYTMREPNTNIPSSLSGSDAQRRFFKNRGIILEDPKKGI